MINYDKLAINDPKDLVYGIDPNPITTRRGVKLGQGDLTPELNYTLPPMPVNESTIAEAQKIYKDMTVGVLQRCVDLGQDQMVLELETVPDYTEHPEWGAEASKIVVDLMDEYKEKYGLKAAYRATPNDMREMMRPPVMRSASSYWDGMVKLFQADADLKSDFISIESTGGKELNDEALINADIRGVIFAMGVAGARDMEYLWGKINEICKGTEMTAAGDSSCGFANTAMVLADKGFIPTTFSAVVRVASVPRALIAYRMGSTGLSKDCEYAGPYVKAITGCPIAMEGRMACGAHLTHVGNIPMYAADTWSNESIQQVKLLSGFAPTAGMEQLIYDCRMANTMAKLGKRNDLAEAMVESDAPYNAQAYILKPEVVIEVSKAIISETLPLMQMKKGCAKVIEILDAAIKDGKLACPERDAAYLERMADAIDEIPDTEEEFYEDIKDELPADKWIPAEYGF